MINEEGTQLEETDDIQSHTLMFFSDLIGGRTENLKSEDINQISRLTKFKCEIGIKTLLHAPFTAEAIKEKFFALPRNKTLSPDGYTAEFFMKAWS